MRPSTLTRLAARDGSPVPPAWDDSGARDWSAFQDRYDTARAVIRSAEDIALVVVEAAEDDAAGGCEWMELQVDPTSYAAVLGGFEAVIEAVLAGAAEAPIGVGVTVASSWARSGEHAEILARLAARYAGDGVTGFGLSNDERRGRVADFSAACRIASDAGLMVTPHAGFFTGPDHVRDCVDILGAARIGHGTSAVADPTVLDLLAERRVALEICPTSYPPLGVHELPDIPIRKALEAGVPVAIGSDDPLLFGTDLAGQYLLCRDVLGLDRDDLATVARNGIDASTAPDELRRRMLAGVEAWAGADPTVDPS